MLGTNGTLEEKFAYISQPMNIDEHIIELQMEQLNINMRAIEPLHDYKYSHVLSENKLTTKEKKMFPVPYDKFIVGKKYYIYVQKKETEIEAIFKSYSAVDVCTFTVKKKSLCLKHDTTKLQVPFDNLITDEIYDINSEIIPSVFTGIINGIACFKHVNSKERIFLHKENMPEFQENMIYNIPMMIQMKFLQYTKDRLVAIFINPFDPSLFVSKNDPAMLVYEYPQMSMRINTHKVRSNSFIVKKLNNSRVSGRS
jgi:hypothetical protein